MRRLKVSQAFLAPVSEKLAYLLTLPPDWDFYGSLPIEPKVAQRAYDLLQCPDPIGITPPTPLPFVCANPTGGVQLEWYTKDIDLVIEVRSDLVAEFALNLDGQQYDGELTSHLALVREAIRRLGS